MKVDDDSLEFIPVAIDKMARYYAQYPCLSSTGRNQKMRLFDILTKYPLILRDKGSGSKAHVDRIFEKIEINA